MKNWNLKYNKPANSWFESLPLGSGDLGAMIFGQIQSEKIDLNLDTLWSGDGHDKINSSPDKNWDQVREKIIKGDYQAAEDYCKKNILGDWTECYLPAGSLAINWLNDQQNNRQYERKLSLNQGIYNQQFISNDILWKQESFIHFEKSILCICFEAEKNGKNIPLSLDLCLESLLQYELQSLPDNTMILKGNAPIYAAPNYCNYENPIRYEKGKGMNYILCLQVATVDGEVTAEMDKLSIRNANKIFIYLNGITDYACKGDLVNFCRQKLAKEHVKGYDVLKHEHIQSFQPIFERMSLEISNETEMDTLKSLEGFQQNTISNYLYELMFQYSKYLLMTSSKPNTEAANLQGIWNPQVRAPWSSNYTININTEMNYWMAEATNLSEFHSPLFDLIEKIAINGKKTAKDLYGLEGWVCHHNTDLWGHTTPVGYNAEDDNPNVYALWPMSGGWLCRHLWEHYEYTGDLDFLKDKAYPIIKGAVEFYMGYLTKYQGYLVTIPSTSPENMFLDDKGNAHALTLGSTMDIAILKELFSNYQKICQILEKPISVNVEKALSLLPPYQIGKNGQLQEWLIDYEEWDSNHRHVSHLYGLYPADSMLKESQEMLKACQNSLEQRGDEGTGWCIAWKAALWARLGKGDRAIKLLQKQLRLTREERILAKGGGVYPNLFCAHPPFQIDGNFGFAAAMLEMIVYTRDDEIKLLPALPSSWKTGKVTGLKVKGGYTLDFQWKQEKVYQLKIQASKVGKINVIYKNKIKEINFEKEHLGQKIEIDF